MLPRAPSLASDAAEAVGRLRNAIRFRLDGEYEAEHVEALARQTRVASALHAVQSSCSTLQDSLEAAHLRPFGLLEGEHHGIAMAVWHEYSSATMNKISRDRTDAKSMQLLELARSCLPWPQRQGVSVELKLHSNACEPLAEDEEASLEVSVDGVFRAVVAVSRQLSTWVPTQVAVGPFHVPIVLGAFQPPSDAVFHDICMRAGVVLTGLDVLGPARRLRPLLHWLWSLHNLFDSHCQECHCVFPPEIAVGAPVDLIPPTARCGHLRPHHSSCFYARFGCSAEDSLLLRIAKDEIEG